MRARAQVHAPQSVDLRDISVRCPLDHRYILLVSSVRQFDSFLEGFTFGSAEIFMIFQLLLR